MRKISTKETRLRVLYWANILNTRLLLKGAEPVFTTNELWFTIPTWGNKYSVDLTSTELQKILESLHDDDRLYCHNPAHWSKNNLSDNWQTSGDMPLKVKQMLGHCKSW